MRQIDFGSGNIRKNVFDSAVPMLVAQMLNLLYNIVDRIYIGRIPGEGQLALGGVGLCFPFVTLVLAFTNLYGIGGSPLCAIERGKGEKEEAERIMNTAMKLLLGTALVLTVGGILFAKPLLYLFGASDATITYALPYMRIYMIGNIAAMTATGMNPYINAQGFPRIGMMTVFIGAAINIVLDPVFIFVFGMGVSGAAVATVISQFASAFFAVRFLTGNTPELRLNIRKYPGMDWKLAKNIALLGTASFIMQFTNSLVALVCNTQLRAFGGDIYVSVYTVISSVRQILDTPVGAISDGSSPVMSFNYGAKKYRRVQDTIKIATLVNVLYTLVVWLIILIRPQMFIRIFTSDAELVELAAPALRIYFFAFFFQAFQYCGQAVFKSLNKKNHAIFFSLFRKVVMVVPLTLLLPHIGGLGVNGVFAAEPISNFIGGSACFITMLLVIYRKLGRLDA